MLIGVPALSQRSVLKFALANLNIIFHWPPFASFMVKYNPLRISNNQGNVLPVLS
jgi:hypothetical protein